MIAEETPDMRQDVAATLALYDQPPLVPVKSLTFTEQQVLDLWFPDTSTPWPLFP